MKQGMYLKLAISNIRKNQKLYIPHILTGIGLIGVFYILLTLTMDEHLSQIKGGNYIPTFMEIGLVVMGILSVILMLYINSFLMKQRKKEFGLYNVLGLEKRHINRILLFETALTAVCAIIAGLIVGMIFYKLCTLLLCRILTIDSIIGFYYIEPKTLAFTALFFIAIYLVTYLFNMVQISRMKAVELLQSANKGEKEPKIKWLLLIIGIATLGSGYFIALTTESPLKALNLFFVAVILVVIGTYCLFITGTIAILKALKRNKKFYYKKNHIISVSGLLYRMKQNSVGLASISILATAVLVMVSITVSMYGSITNTLNYAYPHKLYLSADYTTEKGENAIVSADVLTSLLDNAAEKNGISITYEKAVDYFEGYCFDEGDKFNSNVDANHSLADTSNLVTSVFMDSSDYENATGINLNLKENQIAVFNTTNSKTLKNNLVIDDNSYEIAKSIDEFPLGISLNVINTYGIVLADEAALNSLYDEVKGNYSYVRNTTVIADYEVKDNASDNAEDNFGSWLEGNILDYVEEQNDYDNNGCGYSIDTFTEAKENLYGLYGSLLFLGLLLAIVFLFATTLIIYYKQISEGYEDRVRFQIMKKVGLSNQEVKSAIKSQILLVFFLPLLVAAVHTAVAFPFILKLLQIFAISNGFFLLCTLISFLAFSFIYILIYSLTGKIYYKIVSK